MWSGILSPTQITAHMAGDFTTGGVQTAWASYAFNTGAGTMMYDRSGNGVHLSSGTGISWKGPNTVGAKCLPVLPSPCIAPLVSDGYVTFAGGNQMQSTAASVIDFTDDTTVELWCRRRGAQANPTVLFTSVRGHT